jgi:hypothetical protein
MQDTHAVRDSDGTDSEWVKLSSVWISESKIVHTSMHARIVQYYSMRVVRVRQSIVWISESKIAHTSMYAKTVQYATILCVPWFVHMPKMICIYKSMRAQNYTFVYIYIHTYIYIYIRETCHMQATSFVICAHFGIITMPEASRWMITTVLIVRSEYSLLFRWLQRCWKRMWLLCVDPCLICWQYFKHQTEPLRVPKAVCNHWKAHDFDPETSALMYLDLSADLNFVSHSQNGTGTPTTPAGASWAQCSLLVSARQQGSAKARQPQRLSCPRQAHQWSAPISHPQTLQRTLTQASWSWLQHPFEEMTCEFQS